MANKVAERLPPELSAKACTAFNGLKESLGVDQFCELIRHGKTSIYYTLPTGDVTKKWFRQSISAILEHRSNEHSSLHRKLGAGSAPQYVASLLEVAKELDELAPPRKAATTVVSSDDRTLAIFEYKMERRADLAKAGKHYYRDVDDLPAFPLVGRTSWLPDAMVPLADVDAAKSMLDSGPPVASAPHLDFLAGQTCEAWSKSLRPGMQITGDACYRLLGLDSSKAAAPKLTFGKCNYVEYYDTCEAAGFELAAHALDAEAGQSVGAMVARGPPEEVWEFSGRNAVPGQNALLVMHGIDELPTTFLVHDRRQKGELLLAEGQNTYHVVPAGTFQPENALYGLARDFSLVRGILRELAEELLGQKEVEQQCHRGEDFLRNPAVSLYVEALKSGALQVFYLGLGLDPVTTKPEILLLMVLDVRAVNLRDYGQLERNWEGEPTVCEWSRDCLFRFIRDPRMLPAGAACMMRALEFFDEIEDVIHEQSARRAA